MWQKQKITEKKKLKIKAISAVKKPVKSVRQRALELLRRRILPNVTASKCNYNENSFKRNSKEADDFYLIFSLSKIG